MDFLQGIPVEYKLDAFNMPRTGTTLCHPKIGYVDTQASISPLVHINGDNAYSPPNTRHETHGNIQSSIPTTATCLSSKMQKKHNPSRPTTHAATTTFSTSHNSISSSILTSLNSTSLAAQKQNLIFHAVNKNLFLKTPFDLRHLTSSSTSFYFLTTISEGLTTQRGDNTT